MKVDPNCKACGGSGINSRGNPCAPCQVNGKHTTTLGEAAVTSPDPDPAMEGFA